MKPSRIITISSGLVMALLILPVIAMFTRFLFDIDGWENYLCLFTDSRQMGLFFKSLGIASGAALVALVTGILFSFLLVRTPLPGKTLWQWIYLVPICIPPHIHANSWIYLSGDNASSGWLSIAGTCLILALSYYPFVVLVVTSGLYAMNQQMEDAALLTQKPQFVVASVTLPLLTPHILAGGIFVFIFSLFNYSVPALLGVHTYPIEIFAQFSAFYNEAKAVAQAFPLVITALALLLLQRHVMGERQYISIHTDLKRIDPVSFHHFKFAAMMIMGIIIFFSVILPTGVLMFQSQTLESIKIAFTGSFGDIQSTFLLSLISATLIICLSFLFAGLIENQTYRCRSLMDIAAFVLFAFPATVVGIALIYFWNRPFGALVYRGPIILIIAYMTLFLPFSIRVMSAAFKQVSPGMMEVGALCRESWWKRVVHIELPLTAHGLAAGWVIAFVLCMGELGATLLVIPPGMGTLSLKIYTLMHYGANPIVAALALVMIGINLFVSAIILFSVHKLHILEARSW